MNMVTIKGNETKKIIFLVLLFVQVSEYALFNVSSVFKSIDESIAVVSLIYVFFVVTTTKAIFLKLEKKIVVYLTSIVIIGLLSNRIFHYQPISNVLSDLIIFTKFIFGYFFSRFLLRNVNLDILKKNVIKFCRISSVVLAAALAINIFTGIFPHYDDFRFFMYSQQLFFGHPTYMGSTCIALMCLLIGFKSKDGKSNAPYILLCMTVAFFSFRFKVLVFLLFFSVFMYYEAKEKQISKVVIAVIIIAGIAFSYQQIHYYYIEHDDFARSALTVTSFKVADDHFPFGTGFAAYGSYQSGVHYSPVYHKYGIDKIWGMTRKESYFISDTFWPMIIGQFGYAGLLMFILFVFNLFSLIKKLKQLSYSYYYSALSCMVYLLISSTSESSFVQPFAVMFFYIIGSFVSQLIEKQDKSYIKRS